MAEVVTPTGPEVKSTLEVGNRMSHSFEVDYYATEIRLALGEALLLHVKRRFEKPQDRSMEQKGFMASNDQVQATGFTRDGSDGWPDNTDLKFVFSDQTEHPYTENGIIKAPFEGEGFIRISVTHRGRGFKIEPTFPDKADDQVLSFTVTSKGVR